MSSPRRLVARIANAGLVLFGLALTVVVGTGGTRLELPGLSIGLHRAWTPLQFMALFAALRVLTSKRSSGLEGRLVTLFARHGLPPRDHVPGALASARIGGLLGGGLGLAIGAADAARVLMGARHPLAGIPELVGVSAAGLGLGAAAGLLAGATCALLLAGVAGALQRPLGRYEFGRWTLATLLFFAPLVLRYAPPAGRDDHTPATLLTVLLVFVGALLLLFVGLPATVLRARRGRWGLALGIGGVLVLAAALAVIAVAGIPGQGGASERPPYPNLLVVSISGLRIDVIGAYDQPNSATPNLDALAARGGLFESAVTPSSAVPAAAASMLLGLYPAGHGLEAADETLRYFGEGLPGTLDAHGYRTAAFVACRCLDGRETGLAGLFQHYSGPTALVDWVRRLALSRVLPIGQGDPPDLVGHAAAPVGRFLDWHRALAGGPWFAWVELAGPLRPRPTRAGPPVPEGWPRAAAELDGVLPLPPTWAGDRWRGRPLRDWVRGYVAAVRTADDQLGQLLVHLRTQAELRRTIVMVVAERGVELGEGGLWFEGGDTLDEAVVHVPWIVFGPAVAAGTTVPGPCSLVDLMPTALGLVGIGGGRQTEGEDLSRYLLPGGEGERDSHAGPVFTETAASERGRERERAVRLGAWKLLRTHGGRERLFVVEGLREDEVLEPRGRQESLRQQLSDMLTRRRAREARAPVAQRR
jgi:arylsulfatase A-like enzyme